MTQSLTTVITALISSFSAIIVCLISNRKFISLMEYKIEVLTNEVKEFNNVKLRTFELEKQQAIILTKMEVLKDETGTIKEIKK